MSRKPQGSADNSRVFFIIIIIIISFVLEFRF